MSYFRFTIPNLTIYIELLKFSASMGHNEPYMYVVKVWKYVS